MIREKVWNGALAVRVMIEEPEAVGKHEYLLVAHRRGYFALYTPRIVAYFRRYLNDDVSGEWFYEFNDDPIPWNRPIGVNYDILVDRPQEEWTIRLRRASPLPSSLLPMVGLDPLRDYWNNQFKEAAYIRDGSANAVLNLSRDASQALWSAVAADSATEYWRHVGPLIRLGHLRHVPLKVYVSGRAIQRLIKPSSTLGDALAQLNVDTSPGAEGGAKLHGIRIPLDVHLTELYEQATYPDGFLHIIIV